jgi:CSLREA domain-containing protein
MGAVVRRSTAVAIALVLLAAAGTAPAAAAGPATAADAPPPNSIVVDSLDDVFADDGACTLREAILNADLDGAVNVGPGECAAGSADVEDVITFSEAGTIALAENLPDVGDATTIDGGGSVAIDGHPASHALATQHATTVTLRGLYLSGVSFTGGAGGVTNRGTLVMEDCVVFNSQATNGAGLYSTGPASIVGSMFTANVAEGAGGAIYELSGGLTVLHSSVMGNTAMVGGGIYSETDLVVDRSDVTGNTATTNLPDERATGGGITAHGLATIDQSTIADNHADYEGGGLFAEGSAEVSRSTLAGNSAGRGGGISTLNDLSIANSTFTGNTASVRGGAVSQLVDNYSLTVRNSTFVDNSSVESPGILAAVIRLQNSLVMGNTPESEPQVDAVQTADSVASLTEPPAGLTVDDILDPTGLGYHGGVTSTVLLVAGPNPAAGAGDQTVCGASPVNGIDQRGLARKAACDLGAVERDVTAPRVTLRPTVTLRAGATLVGVGAPASLAWAATDAGSGLHHAILERSRNGGPWGVVASVATSPVAIVLPTGGTTRYRVIAIDMDGNASGPAAGPVRTTRLVQQGSSSIRYAGRWTRVTAAKASGGSRVYATKAGASATFTFTGRSVAFVTTRGPSRGKVAVYQGTRRVATLDLRGATAERYVAWSRAWSTSATRTIRLVVLGTSGRPRIDVDAFVVQK